MSDKDMFHASHFRLTFEGGKPILSIGQGNHTVIRFQLNWDQVRGLVLDAHPELLKR